ncbi:MAG: alpha/beta hydrolase [Sphingobacteriales bacterium]|nr:MAG: alpha/beta hydrolase [Sphingobacteriales bacterium]
MSVPVFKDHFIDANRINLHYIEYGTGDNVLLMLHGLTANAHAFDGLVAKGLDHGHRIISLDMRGRGLSYEPAFRYSVDDHADDILGLMDGLGLKKVTIVGHSFGGYIGFYLAANYPERIEKLIVLDAAIEMNPNIVDMLAYAVSRVDKKFTSFADYLTAVKAAPYNTFWDDAMLSYYRADVKDNDDGSVTPYSNLANITEMSLGLSRVDWTCTVKLVKQPTLLLNAMDEYTMGEPLLPEEKAKETVAVMQDVQYVQVDGNHQTMLYGDGAKQIVKAIDKFLTQEA